MAEVPIDAYPTEVNGNSNIKFTNVLEVAPVISVVAATTIEFAPDDPGTPPENVPEDIVPVADTPPLSYDNPYPRTPPEEDTNVPIEARRMRTNPSVGLIPRARSPRNTSNPGTY